jgi:hypothetical protein
MDVCQEVVVAFISCAEIDPCRDEAIDYANRLLHARVLRRTFAL